MTNTTTPETEQRYLRIDYVARTGDGRIIDTTDPDVAAESDLADLEASGPVVVVPGEGHLFEPLEEAIRDAESGETIEMAVGPEDAFGTADPGKMATLDKEAVAPEHRNAGSTVQLGGRRAVVEEVSDGTVTVDFNHPLAGLTLEYEIEVLERLEGIERRAAGLTATHGLRDASIDYDRESGTLAIRFPASKPDADRDDRKRSYIDDVRRLFDIESIKIVERYE
jgi:FKBP-type peptidyl-prolyl cis-trans isomerase SlyD